MDVSNPSLVLIVFGILLLLAPRMMPDNGSDQNAGSFPMPDQHDTVNIEETNSATPTDLPAENTPQRTIPKIYSPPAIQGRYQLTTYIEDGETINADGQLIISTAKNGVFPFTGSLQAYVDWATTVNYQYEGYLAQRGKKWFLKINAASDPQWADRGEVSMTLVNDGNSITMKYHYGAELFVVWQR